MANPLYAGDNRTYLLTITDSAGNPPAGGTLAWTIEHVVKEDDDDTVALITKSSADPAQIEPATPNPDQNQWYIYYTPADTAALGPGTYVRFTKVTTGGGEVFTIARDDLPLLAKGVA